MALKSIEGKWALILGASSGFGEAISLQLAKSGMNIVGVHLDRKATLPHVEEVVSKIKGFGRQALFFNVNAADSEKRKEILEKIKEVPGCKISCLVHSLAFGSLKLFISDDPKEEVTKEQLEMTLDVMANSLVYWVQDVRRFGLLARGGQVFAMTSAGGTRVWPNYGPVSAAKAALECHCRQLALELARDGVAVNAIRAGVTDTPALRKIPGNEVMINLAAKRNPYRRLTTPEDVANIIDILCHQDGSWMTGNTLGVDGGEDIVG